MFIKSDLSLSLTHTHSLALSALSLYNLDVMFKVRGVDAFVCLHISGSLQRCV